MGHQKPALPGRKTRASSGSPGLILLMGFDWWVVPDVFRSIHSLGPVDKSMMKSKAFRTCCAIWFGLPRHSVAGSKKHSLSSCMWFLRDNRELNPYSLTASCFRAVFLMVSFCNADRKRSSNLQLWNDDIPGEFLQEHHFFCFFLVKHMPSFWFPSNESKT